MAENQEEHFDYRAFIAKHGGGTVTKFSDKHTVYAQGDSADVLFFTSPAGRSRSPSFPNMARKP